MGDVKDWLPYSSSIEVPQFQEPIFCTRCKSFEKLCNVIIDPTFQKNFVSTYMVDKLDLETTRHPFPYKVRWFNTESYIEVTKRAIFPFKIGGYVDYITCDIIPMDDCHILFGGPWTRFKRARYNDCRHTYSIDDYGKRIRLHPLFDLESVSKPKGNDEDDCRLNEIKVEEKSDLVLHNGLHKEEVHLEETIHQETLEVEEEEERHIEHQQEQDKVIEEPLTKAKEDLEVVQVQDNDSVSIYLQPFVRYESSRIPLVFSKADHVVDIEEESIIVHQELRTILFEERENDAGASRVNHIIKNHNSITWIYLPYSL